MDTEFRVLLTGEGKEPEQVIMWGTDENGQWEVIEADILPAFSNRMEVALHLARMIASRWTKVHWRVG